MTQLQGQILAASPHIAGVAQARAVVMVLGHSEQGTTGVVLNHPLNETLHHSVRQMLSEGKTPQLIHDLFTPPTAGGAPAPTNRLPLPQIPLGNNTVAVPFGILVAPAPDAEGGSGLGLMVRVMVGQVQWPAGQLEKEIEAGAWMSAPASPELVFGEHTNLWQAVVSHVGDDSIRTALGIDRVPIDPQMN